MRILVLGGTAWVGREVAAQASAAGHEVVCVARGESGAVADGVRLLVADRDRPDALDPLAGERWDAAVDVSRQPGHVRRATEALSDVAHFVFVSTANVYADETTPGQDESSALREPLGSDTMASMEEYGPAKVACEQAVQDVFGERCAIARAGLIGGPGDWSDRTSYWPSRCAAPSNPAGAVLAPDVRDLPTSVIDARDLAAWLLLCATERVAGAYNACGPVVAMEEHLAAARSAVGHSGEVVWADPDWLREHDVHEWMGPRSLPLWLPDDSLALGSLRGDKAYAAGLAPRPLEETLSDVANWRQQDPERPWRSGLTDDEERTLLESLRIG
jgi:nucleoside-diphosphate-sugar epimerase